MNWNQRLYYGFHAAMGVVYVSTIGLHLVGWYAARDVILLFGVALWSFALLTYWALRSIGQLRDTRQQAACATHRPSGSGLAPIPLIPARQAGSTAKFNEHLLVTDDSKQRRS
jgi:hypothetical protein